MIEKDLGVREKNKEDFQVGIIKPEEAMQGLWLFGYPLYRMYSTTG